MAEAGLVAAGQERGAGRGAIGAGDVSVGEADARGRERIEVRGRDILAAMEADVGVAHVVADDDEDVGPVGGEESDGEQQEGEQGAHRLFNPVRRLWLRPAPSFAQSASCAISLSVSVGDWCVFAALCRPGGRTSTAMALSSSRRAQSLSRQASTCWASAQTS